MIWILGAGAFGTGLAISLAQSGPVTLWSRDPTHVDEMIRDGENLRRLPGYRLPEAVQITSDPGALAPDAICLLCVPMQRLGSLLNEHADVLRGHVLVACCKGIDLERGIGPTALIAAQVPSARGAILTGPSFATDIARGLPTALTLACREAILGHQLQARLSTPNLRIYRSLDMIGAELGGALKNVIAIACGAVMGAGLGESARAALMTRGFAEMQKIARVLGAEAETLSGLSGFGDLVLTCSSEQSRNYRFGLSLGRGEVFDPGLTVEGVATAEATLSLAATHRIDMPITQAVVALSSGKMHVLLAMDLLLKRPLKEE